MTNLVDLRGRWEGEGEAPVSILSNRSISRSKSKQHSIMTHKHKSAIPTGYIVWVLHLCAGHWALPGRSWVTGPCVDLSTYHLLNCTLQPNGRNARRIQCQPGFHSPSTRQQALAPLFCLHRTLYD